MISRERPEIASHMREILELVGEAPARQGLQKTPERWEKSMRFLTSGYSSCAEDLVNGASFTAKFNEMVIVKDIEFFSLCEHHLLPFFGKMHVAYLPTNRVIGLSKIPRLVDRFARRLQAQERLTREIAEALSDTVDPRGVAVLCEASHFCMMMRGVQKQQSSTITSAMLGAFRDNRATRDQFLSLVNRGPR